MWNSGNEPMIFICLNRIEILSRGTLALAQTMEGFSLGELIPVNEKLSEIFLQLHISEKSGCGVPKIIEKKRLLLLGVSKTAVENNLTFMKENGYVERVGSKETGYWKALE